MTLSPHAIGTLSHTKAAGALPSALISLSLQGLLPLEGREKTAVLEVGMVEMQQCKQTVVSKQHTYLIFAVDVNYKTAKTTACMISGPSLTTWQILGEGSEASPGALGQCQTSRCWI